MDMIQHPIPALQCLAARGVDLRVVHRLQLGLQLGLHLIVVRHAKLSARRLRSARLGPKLAEIAEVGRGVVCLLARRRLGGAVEPFII